MTFVHGKTGSSKILSAPAATEQRLSELEQLLGISRQHTEQATEQPVSRLRDRLGLTENTTEPITQKVTELTEQLEQHTRQLTELSKQVTQLSDVVSSSEFIRLADQVTDLADKVDERKASHNKLVAMINNNTEVVKRLPSVVEGQADRLYQLLLDHIEVGSLTDEAMELLRERAKVADERRGELAKVDVVLGKVTAPGYKYLPNIGMSVREKD